MISLKELQYVGSFPKYAPFPGEKYAQETLENAKECLDDFDNLHKGKNYNIIFSDAIFFFYYLF